MVVKVCAIGTVSILLGLTFSTVGPIIAFLYLTAEYQGSPKF